LNWKLDNCEANKTVLIVVHGLKKKNFFWKYIKLYNCCKNKKR